MLEISESNPSSLTVEIWSDVICPFCPIGLRNLEVAIESFAERDHVTLIHRSFRLQPGANTFSVYDYLSQKFGPGLADSKLQQVSNLFAQAGLLYRQEALLSGDTMDAHRLLHFARRVGKQNALLKKLYVGYFSGLTDIFNRDSLIGHALEVGLERQAITEVLDSDQFASEVEADENEARAKDIRSVPHLVIDSRISVSGAQSSEAYLAALTNAWQSQRHVPEKTDDASVCDTGICYIR